MNIGTKMKKLAMICIKHSWISTISYRSDWNHFYKTRFSICTKCKKVMELPLSNLRIDYSKAPTVADTWWKGLKYNSKKVIPYSELCRLRGFIGK